MAEPGEQRGRAGDTGGGCAGLGDYSSNKSFKFGNLNLRDEEADPAEEEEEEVWEDGDGGHRRLGEAQLQDVGHEQGIGSSRAQITVGSVAGTTPEPDRGGALHPHSRKAEKGTHLPAAGCSSWSCGVLARSGTWDNARIIPALGIMELTLALEAVPGRLLPIATGCRWLWK
ncbi:hypothetical protein DUI87_25458 [Hirundo rustica rustica]|uniref:Uncharacterized protein n=1 Tax=Hirundo rustica rustica TaxID=333673 RepID=A0A3M0JCH6_HIRRU|nr:hypothetical protein DUI87_25458 [Hirundo rustica rustica]